MPSEYLPRYGTLVPRGTELSALRGLRPTKETTGYRVGNNKRTPHNIGYFASFEESAAPNQVTFWP